MSIRLTCSACHAAFLAADDAGGQRVACPKCGAKQMTLKRGAVKRPEPAEASVFVPSADAPSRRRFRPAWLALFLLVSGLAVATVVAWPTIQAWWHPVPPDPIEVVASTFLRSLSDENPEVTRQVSIIDEPPAIRSFRNVRHDPTRDRPLKGSFRPIAQLHDRLNKSFEYNAEIGRYQPRDLLGPAAETLDALHTAKAEQAETAKKIASGSPDDLFAAAEAMASTFDKLAEGALAPKKLIPTYQQLVEDAKPPLPPSEKELALDFGSNRETWDHLLKRPFPTLKADGPYILDRAEVTAMVADRLASSGDPPTRLYLKLMRFRLEGIDTGWKVISARREGDPEPVAEPTEAAPPAEPVRRSPGESAQ
ncbi:zinc ribbon domain-containing protein [Singulisphaera acidiphila]|uniref:Uncharacterized protein n=1 Tax=Singulisphaera acidiphila (strain ATCC BAA-1392 / DSM 18658 / VKM B-2454 / MOB10) TaxID=886293 RepID=L0DBB4_SINAD|nr:hypothetical protein [Singulisphaera acidiphila]AGA26674.1 hypothetical protein Sinac_2362 [Singulisphaera acidiphila DSM 18658]